MAEKIQGEIPYAIIEYTVSFEGTIAHGWGTPPVIVDPVLQALRPFGFGLDGIELKDASDKLNEFSILFKRTRPPSPALNFVVGLEKATLTVENPDWSEAEFLMKVAEAAMGSLMDSSKCGKKSQHLVANVHLQLKNRKTTEVGAALLNPNVLQLLDGEIQAPGIILVRNKASLVIDGSLAYANALFIRIIREHAPEVPLKAMADCLMRDEIQLFELLGVEAEL
jgi:hypothetical protein